METTRMNRFAYGSALFVRLAARLGFALALAAGCSAEQGATPGQLTVALTTNMTPGVDFDALRMIVKRDDTMIQDLPYTWPRGGVGESPVRFPATFSVINRTSGQPRVTVRFEAKQGAKLRIVREAVTTLPVSGQFTLPILLDWLCLDKIPVASPVDVQCAEAETCIAGVCETPNVDVTTLAAFSTGEVFGGGTGQGASGTCFDVLGTFNGAERYVPEKATGACGVPFTNSGTDGVNVAVALPAGSAGFCYTGGEGGCLVPLEAGGPGGWKLVGGRLTVPDRVCTTPNAKVAVIRGKPTKAVNQPPCGSFSSVGSPDAATPPTTVIVTDADAGAGVRDAGLDATVADAEGGVDAASDAALADGGGEATRDSGEADAGCASESDDLLRTRLCLGRNCGSVSGTDNCGVVRTVASCGSCLATQTCDSSNVCVCTGESDAQLRTANCGAQSCGSKSVQDRCGVPRTVDCGASCDAPPSATCQSGTSMTTYARTGTCVSNACTYASTTTACAAASCSAGVATTAGPCANGVCAPGAQTSCTFGCNASGTACADDPCASYTCPSAPAPTCANASTRRTFSGPGTCSSASGSAQCAYAQTDTVCNTPPAATCVNSTTRRTFASTGTCSNVVFIGGVCSYAPTDQACNAGQACSNGACVCAPESDPQLCGSRNCGTYTVMDRCGQTRRPNCGACSGVNTCGGGGTANVCGCATETDAAFCTRLGVACGSKSGTDNCGVARTVASCGACSAGMVCSMSNRCEVAPAQPSWSLVTTYSLATLPSGAQTKNGAAGSQAVATVGGASCWNQTSDWNYLWVPHPAASARKLRIEVDVYRNNSSNHVRLSALATGPNYAPDTWIETAVNVYSNVTQSPSGSVQTTTSRAETRVGTFATALQQQGAWSTIRQDIDRDAGTTTVWANGAALGTWPITEVASAATFIVLNSNGSGGSYCWKNLKVYSAP